MPRYVSVSPEQIDWLREAKRNAVPYAVMASHIGCCEDTVKRILVKHNIATFSSEKYNAIATKTKTWNRPCNRCGSTKSRPRFQFTCDACHSAVEYDINADWAVLA